MIGKEEDVVQRAGEAQVHHFILAARRHPFHAAPAPPLGAEGVGGHALYICVCAEADQHVLLRDQVFLAEVAAGVMHNRGAAFVTVFLLQLDNVVQNQAANLVRMGQ